MSYNDPNFVTTIEDNFGASSFQLALETAQDLTGDHGEEMVGYVVWEVGVGTINDIKFDAVLGLDATTGHDNGCDANAHNLGQVPVVAIAQQRDRGGGNGK